MDQSGSSRTAIKSAEDPVTPLGGILSATFDLAGLKDCLIRLFRQRLSASTAWLRVLYTFLLTRRKPTSSACGEILIAG